MNRVCFRHAFRASEAATAWLEYQQTNKRERGGVAGLHDFSTPSVKSIKPLMASAWLLFTSPLASSLTTAPSLRRMWKIVCKPGTAV
jgi:hypothetical protein